MPNVRSTITPFVGRKRQIASEFVRRILNNDVAPNIAKIILFGSVARDAAGPQSDIDILVISTGDLGQVDAACGDLAYALMLEFDESIELMVYCIDEYRRPGYFLEGVKAYGREIYSTPDDRLRKNEAEDLLDLSRKYLAMSKSLMSPESLRGAIDMAYNAAEPCVKGMMLLRSLDQPTTHGGTIRQFSNVIVQDGAAPPELGRALRRAMEKRNRARYDPHVTFTDVEANETIETAERIVELLEKELAALNG